MYEILDSYYIEGFETIEKGLIEHNDGDVYNIIEILSIDCINKTVTLLIKK